jgi:hypothetical protein
VYGDVLAAPEGMGIRLGIEQAIRAFLEALEHGTRPARVTDEVWRRLAALLLDPAGQDPEAVARAAELARWPIPRQLSVLALAGARTVPGSTGEQPALSLTGEQPALSLTGDVAALAPLPGPSASDCWTRSARGWPTSVTRPRSPPDCTFTPRPCATASAACASSWARCWTRPTAASN